jgi:hypothetical protein
MGHQEGTGEARRCPHQDRDPIQFRILTLTLSPSRSPGQPRLQIDVHDTYEIGFGCSTYASKEDEINITMPLVSGPNRIGFDHNCQNNFNI